jgi:hypothetical protein
MAKAFYSMEEVCELLSKSADEVKALVRDGSLREFRDAGKIFFKAEDVNKLTGGELSTSEDSGEITLEPAPEPEPEPELPTLAEGEGTSFIGLEAVDDSPPERGRKAPDTSGRPPTTGIGVFDDDELEIDADPMAETQITTTPGEDQVALEGTGSGSGLLDLTREADDTSLGAELLDEIYPGEEEAVEAAPPAAEAEAEEQAEEEAEPAAEPAVVAVETAPALTVTVGDPSEGLFSGLMVGALLVLVVAGSVVASMLQGFFPDYAQTLSNYFWWLLIGAVVVPILSLLIGWVIGKTAIPKRA